MLKIDSMPKHNNQISFNAHVKNTPVLRNVLKYSDKQELSRFNSILDEMPKRFDGKIYDFVEMISNGVYKLCMNDVIRPASGHPLMIWHSKDLASGRSLEEVYSQSLKKANDKLSRIYVSAEIKDAPRSVSIAEIYSKLA